MARIDLEKSKKENIEKNKLSELRSDNRVVKIQNTEVFVGNISNWANYEKQLRNYFTVFLHSANYKFSLGSGSSYLIKQIIDVEKNLHGKSVLEKEIQKIKKTRLWCSDDEWREFPSVVSGKKR